MKKFLLKLAEFFEDGTGALSAMRLLFIVWGMGVFSVWAFLSIKHGQMQAIDLSILGFLISLTGGKIIQNFTENSTPSQPPTPTS